MWAEQAKLAYGELVAFLSSSPQSVSKISPHLADLVWGKMSCSIAAG